MASEAEVRREAQTKFADLAQRTNWGLKKCTVDQECQFCKIYGDYPNTVYQFRNFYTSGMPSEIIGVMIDPAYSLPLNELEAHAARQHWKTKRSSIRGQVITPEHVSFLMMRRAAQGMNVVSGNSTDKMIQLLAQTQNMTKPQQSVQVNNFSWETIINQNGKDGKEAILELDDDDDFIPIVEQRLLLEGEVESQ